AFNKFFKEHKGYPRFKSKNKSVPSFRIQKNRNNIRVSNKRIRLAKLGFVHYRTSKKYRKLLKTSKINNVTVKRKNGKYYAIVNIKTEVEELEKTGETIGIDLGLKKLATLSNTTEIDTLDLKKEEEMIKKIPKTISTKRIHEQQLQKNTKKNYING
ncbi:MAG: transposase, partial [Clostridia bacterium]|nr:transposase [Clostridia bacterium]